MRRGRRGGRGRRRGRFAAPALSAPRARALAVLLGIAGAGVTDAGLVAQQVDVVPLVGVRAPLDDLGWVRAADGELAVLGRPESALAFGVAVEIGLGRSLGVRGDLLVGASADVPVTGPEGGEGCPGCETTESVRVLTGSLVLRPFGGLPFVRPYLLAGGGVRRFGLETADLAAAGSEEPEDGQTRRVVRVGAGVDIDLGLLEALVEVSDAIGRFEAREGDDELHHDAFLLVGLRF